MAPKVHKPAFAKAKALMNQPIRGPLSKQGGVQLDSVPPSRAFLLGEPAAVSPTLVTKPKPKKLARPSIR